MVLQVFNNSDYSNWRVIVMFFIVCLMLLLGNMIRRRVKIFRKLLFPIAFIAGFIGLGIKYLLFGLDVQIGGSPILTNDFLNSITYHTIALGFIAMGLKDTKKNENNEVKGRPIKTGLLIVNTYLIQGIIGIIITIVLSYVFVNVESYGGLLLPMGFGQGPGQAGNIGGIFEGAGHLQGRAYGLAIATIGTLWASVGGIFYINRRKKEGKLVRVKEEKGVIVTNRQIESSEEIPVSEAIDKMSMQIIFVAIVYGISYFFMLGLTNIIKDPSFTGLIWGFNFIFGMLFAMLFKTIFNKFRDKGWIRRKYSNEYMLDRITGVVFDFMIVASIMSINVEIFTDPGLLTSLVVLGVVGGFLTYFYLKYTVYRIYPDYKYEAYASIFGNLTGTASNGIALLREVDPNFETPAADDLVSGSASAVMFGAPILVITAIIYRPEWYWVWLSLAILVVIFTVFNYFMLRDVKKEVTE